jgi:hypothetical protein
MLCIQRDISNKPSIIVDDLGASTSHASDSEIKSLFIKLVIVDTTCLDNCDNSCLKNCVEHESKDHHEKQTQGKFVPTCHHYGIIGHIRQNCYMLKFQKLWNKQDAPRKGKIEKFSKFKYVPPHRRHISQKGIGIVICENPNKIFCKMCQEAFKQKKPAYLPSMWRHWTHQATLSSDPLLEAMDKEAKANER